jgi:hypothetical protein
MLCRSTVEYGGMLTRRDVAVIAVAQGLEGSAARLSKAVVPGWHLQPKGGAGVVPLGASKLGGGADLAVGETWPTNRRGIALTFLAQIDCAALPGWAPEWDQSAVWPHGGRLLRFFADLVDNPVGISPALVMACSPTARLRRVEPPPLPSRWPAGGPCDEGESEERYPRLGEAAISALPYVGVPSYPSVHLGLGDLLGTDRYEALLAVMTGAPGGSSTTQVVHSLLGPAISINIDDVRSMVAWLFESPDPSLRFGASTEAEGADGAGLTEEEAWTSLLHLEDDAAMGLNLRDSVFTLMVPRNDLARASYDRVFCVPQWT